MKNYLVGPVGFKCSDLQRCTLKLLLLHVFLRTIRCQLKNYCEKVRKKDTQSRKVSHKLSWSVEVLSTWLSTMLKHHAYAKHRAKHRAKRRAKHHAKLCVKRSKVSCHENITCKVVAGLLHQPHTGNTEEIFSCCCRRHLSIFRHLTLTSSGDFRQPLVTP